MRGRGLKPPFHPLMMTKILIILLLHGLSDNDPEYQIGGRLSFMNFLHIQMDDHIPDAKTN
ncbi:MAG: transposase [Akkermansiaceae bacterium]